LGVQANLSDLSAGDSIAVNGVCLTLTNNKDLLLFDVVKATVDTTNLSKLRVGDYVNLEPALRVGDKLSGHFVLGHVDTQGAIKAIRDYRHNWIFKIKYPDKFSKYVVDKGSVAVEGISLTIQQKGHGWFGVSIIPFTYRDTNLKYKKVGSKVNLEFDYLLKRQN
jgi:riboflavin synthase